MLFQDRSNSHKVTAEATDKLFIGSFPSRLWERSKRSKPVSLNKLSGRARKRL